MALHPKELKNTSKSKKGHKSLILPFSVLLVVLGGFALKNYINRDYAKIKLSSANCIEESQSKILSVKKGERIIVRYVGRDKDKIMEGRLYVNENFIEREIHDRQTRGVCGIKKIDPNMLEPGENIIKYEIVDWQGKTCSDLAKLVITE